MGFLNTKVFINMNLQENIQRIREMMGLINEKFNEGLQVMLIETFDKRILNTGVSGGYVIRYSVDGEDVGAIEGNNWKNYLVVGHIYLTPEYRGKGHSVEFYKDALEYAKEQGYDGLMVGGQLTTPHKTRRTYDHFEHHETEIKNEHGKPYVVLTNFIS